MKKRFAIGAMIGAVLITGALLLSNYFLALRTHASDISSALPRFTGADLAMFNGDDPSQPIYLALDGYVYDVTAGKKFYEPGGDYHYLAGRDASKDLKIFGGSIIKHKYPIVGLLDI